MSWDTYRGTYTLPDGRQVNAVLHGYVLPAPDYWEDAPKDALDIEWIDGTPLEADDYNTELTVNGKPYYLHEWVVEQLVAHGEFEYGGYDDD